DFLKRRGQVIGDEAPQIVDLDVLVRVPEQVKPQLSAVAALLGFEDHGWTPRAAAIRSRIQRTSWQAWRRGFSVSGVTEVAPLVAALASWLRLLASRAVPRAART